LEKEQNKEYVTLLEEEAEGKDQEIEEYHS